MIIRWNKFAIVWYSLPQGNLGKLSIIFQIFQYILAISRLAWNSLWFSYCIIPYHTYFPCLQPSGFSTYHRQLRASYITGRHTVAPHADWGVGICVVRGQCCRTCFFPGCSAKPRVWNQKPGFAKNIQKSRVSESTPVHHFPDQNSQNACMPLSMWHPQPWVPENNCLLNFS